MSELIKSIHGVFNATALWHWFILNMVFVGMITSLVIFKTKVIGESYEIGGDGPSAPLARHK